MKSFNRNGPTGESAGGVARAAGIIALGNVSSRVLGLVRVTLIAGFFGATGLVSAYQVAATVPTMIYDLLIGGMLSSALVPVFSEYATAHTREEFSKLVGILLSLAVIAMTTVVIIIELFAPQIAWLLSGGFSPQLQAVTIQSTRIVAVALLFFGLSGVVTATLYTLKRFKYPAFGAAAFNLGIILCAILLSKWLGIYSLAVGVLVGSLLQFVIQLPEFRHIPLRMSLNVRHPGVSRIVRLYLPVLAGLLVGQLQVGIDRNLASRTGDQSIAWMQNATTLIQFPHGLVAVAISLAVLPSLSRFNALKNWEGYRETLSLGLRMVLALIVPASVALFILAQPIVTLIFEHGRFTPMDTFWTVLALRYYLFGLLFASVDWPLNYAFYARQDTLTPALVGVFSVAVYLIVALSMLPTLGMIGLVLADSFKQFSHAAAMLALTYLRLGGLENRRIGIALGKTLVMSTTMGIGILALVYWLLPILPFSKLINNLVLVGVASALGLVLYVACGAILGHEEMAFLWQKVRQRLGSSFAAGNL